MAPLRAFARFTFLRHDVQVPLEVSEPLDEIYNLASPASPPLYQMDPIDTFRTNVIGAMNLLDLAERKGARILQASTSEVYGDPEVCPQPEDYRGRVNTWGPRACYDEGKRAAETLFHDYHERRGVCVKVARIFNTYGPGMNHRDGRVVSNFATAAAKGEPLCVYGDGSQTRSLCYVSDLVDGLIRLMSSPDEVTGPINLGNDEEYTILNLAETVIDLTGTSSRVVFRDLPQDDPMQRRPDITQARRLLGWSPRISRETGLRQTLPYFGARVTEGAPHVTAAQ